MPRRVSSIVRATFAQRTSPSHQRVASRPASWLEPVQVGQAEAGKARSVPSTTAARSRALNGASVNGKLKARCSSSRSAPKYRATSSRSNRKVSPTSKRGGVYRSASARQRRMMSCTSGWFRLWTRRWPPSTSSGRSPGRAGGLSRSSRSTMSAGTTSMRKPSIPLSNQKRSDVVEGRPHVLVPPVEVDLLRGEAVEVELSRVLVPGPRRPSEQPRRPVVGRSPAPAGSAQMYQSRCAAVRELRASRNHGCWALVWLGTRSKSTRMPRRCAWRTSSSTSASVP